MFENLYLIKIDLINWYKIDPEPKFSLLLPRLSDLQIVCLYRIVKFDLAKLRKDPIFSMNYRLPYQLIEQSDKVRVVHFNLYLAILREG